MKNRTLFLILISFILSLVSCSAMVSDLKDLNKKGDLIVETYFETVDSTDDADYSKYVDGESYTLEQISVADCNPKDYSGFEFTKKEVISEADNTIVKFYFKRKIIVFQLNPNGGSWWDGETSQKFISGKFEAPVEVPQEYTLTKEGFTFVGWEPELPSTYLFDSVYTAEWTDRELNTYTVTFDANGGQGYMSDQQFTERIFEKLTQCAFTKNGYKFAGWARDPEGPKFYVDEQSIRVTQDMTLYAVWEEKTDLTIFYHDYFHKAEIDTKEDSFKFTDDVTLEQPIIPGYTFRGWYLTQDFTGTAVTGWIAGTYEKDVHVYGKWEANVHTITFNANGGQGQMDPQSFTYGTSTDLKLNTFTRTGYSFAGWAKSEDGKKEFLDGMAYVLLEDTDLTFYAVWTENGSFEIEYKNIQEGDVNPNQTSYKEKDSVTINPASRTGYDFGGWYYNEALNDGPVTGWAAGEKSGKVTLWAKWTAKTYKITFDKNNGEGTLADQAFAYNETKPLSKNTFTRLGYNFAGWSETKVEDNSAASYADEAEYTFTSNTDVTLYAVWSKRPSHIIKYEDAGTHSNPAEFEETDTVSLNGAVKTGYTFDGWYENADFTGSAVTGWSAGEKTDDVTLYAKWTANTYTVTFDPNGGTGTMNNPQTFTYGVAGTLDACTYLKTGYKFAGWGLTKDDTTSTYADKASYTTPAQDITLYAIWIAGDSLLIVYNNTDSKTTNTNNSSFYVRDPVTITDASKPGYTFKGWYENADFTGTAVTGWSAGDKTEDVTLYAKWEALSYSVSFDSNDGTGTMASVSYVYEKPANLPANSFTKTGYDFAGWSTEKNGTKAYSDQESFVLTEPNPVTLFAVWTKRPSHTITYEAANGTHSNSTVFEETDAVTINAAAKTGYTFKGWYETENFEGSAVTGWSAGDKTEDVTLYAKWEANTYTITFNANDESAVPATSTQTFTYDSPVNLKPNTFVNIGYDFTGWAAASDGTKIYDDKASYPATTANDVTLYAVWNQRAQHSIKYETGLLDTTINGPDKFWEKDSVTLGTAEKTGYTFSGWYETENFTGSAITGWAAGNKTEDITLYAKMVPVAYKVIFDSNTGSGSMTSQSVPFETTVTLKSNTFTKTGYDFKGWSTSAGDSTVDYANGASYKQSVTNDVTLYAVWEVKTYTVTFNANGGSGSMAPQSFKHNELQALTANSFVRSGYEFAGWATSPDAKDFIYSDEQTVTLTNGNITLYAVWHSKIEGIGITDTITGDLILTAVVNGTTVTITATPPYSADWTYEWFIEGEKQPETTATITKTLTSKTHTIFVNAIPNFGELRSKSITVTVN